MSSYSKTGNSALRQNNLLCFPKINLSVRNSVVLPAHPLTIMSICSSIHWFITFNVYWKLNRRIAEILISQSSLYLFPLSKHSPIKPLSMHLPLLNCLIPSLSIYPSIHPSIHSFVHSPISRFSNWSTMDYSPTLAHANIHWMTQGTWPPSPYF